MVKKSFPYEHWLSNCVECMAYYKSKGLPYTPETIEAELAKAGGKVWEKRSKTPVNLGGMGPYQHLLIAKAEWKKKTE